MNRISRLRWWWQSTWGATLAGFGIHRPSRATAAFKWNRPGPPPDFSKIPRPTWIIPDDEIGVAAGTRAMLTVDERRAVALIDCVGYSNGFEFTISYRTRDKLPLHRPGPFVEMEVHIVYPDGASAGRGTDAMDAHYEAAYVGAEPPIPNGPVVMPQRGGGTDKRHDFSFWGWPLPPDGPVTVTVAWAMAGLPATSAEIDASAIHRAGLQSKKLWS